MSPRSFQALVERHAASRMRDERLEFLRTGILASVMANGLLKRDNGEPFTAADFMPAETKPEELPEDPAARGELELAKFRMIAGQ